MKLIFYNIQKSTKLFERNYLIGFLWSMISVLASKGSILAASFFVARHLGKFDFGKLGLIQSTILVFSSLAGLGINLTMTKYVAEYKLKDMKFVSILIREYGFLTLLSGIFFTIITIIFAPLLANNILNSPDLSKILQFASLIIFFDSISSFFNSILFGLKNFKIIARINTLSGIVNFFVVLALTYFGDLVGAVWGFVISSFFTLLINFIFIQIEFRKVEIEFYFENKFTQFQIFFKFSLPALLSSLMIAPAFWACSAILVSLTSNYSEIGIFNAANQWRSFILFLPATLSNVVLPYLSSHLTSDKRNDYNTYLNSSLIITLAISILIAIPLIYLSPFIMSKYGSGFEHGYSVLNYIIASSVLSSVNGVIGMAIISKGKLWLGFCLNLMWALVLVSLSYYFTRLNYGALGLAISNFIAYLLHTIWQLIYLISYNKRNRV